MYNRHTLFNNSTNSSANRPAPPAPNLPTFTPNNNGSLGGTVNLPNGASLSGSTVGGTSHSARGTASGYYHQATAATPVGQNGAFFVSGSAVKPGGDTSVGAGYAFTFK